MSNLSKALGVWTILPRSLLLAAIALLISFGAVAQTLLSTNMYAWTLQNNSVLQSNLTNQMINLGGKPTSGSGAPLCLPPFDLQRGPAGVIPPALQGDPRFQKYLHCRYGNVPITPAMANAAPLPVSPAAGGAYAQGYSAPPPGGTPARQPPGQPAVALPRGQHFPIAATDFVPVAGHPAVEQQLASMPISPDDRARVLQNVNATFEHVAKKYRGNNLAVAIVYAYGAAEFTLHATKTTSDQMHDRVRQINDAIAQSGQFARMSDEQKQSNADTWIFESAILNMLRAAGQRGDQQAVQQAVQLAQVMMQRLLAL
jgi:hypothetical protein